MIRNTTEIRDTFNRPTHHGFHLTFGNGWTVSIQWGRSMYCDTRDSGEAKSENAEIACWPSEGGLARFATGDTVMGWVDANQVARFIAFIAAIDPANPPALIDLEKI